MEQQINALGGAATSLHALGYGEAAVMALGGWMSTAMQHYLHKNQLAMDVYQQRCFPLQGSEEAWVSISSGSHYHTAARIGNSRRKEDRALLAAAPLAQSNTWFSKIVQELAATKSVKKKTEKTEMRRRYDLENRDEETRRPTTLHENTSLLEVVRDRAEGGE
jgi:hypothetical protein